MDGLEEAKGASTGYTQWRICSVDFQAIFFSTKAF